VELVYVELQPDRGTAMRRERSIKSMTHAKKNEMAEAYQLEKETHA
jgi:predicted GIY-YIG superfamily endonuclease